MSKLSNALSNLLMLAIGMFSASTGFANLQQDIRNQGAEHNVEIRLLLKKDVPSASTDVHVDKNIMQLAGFVDNKQQMRNVIQVAKKCQDKYRVINNVKVETADENPEVDLGLKNDVITKLKADNYSMDKIEVQTRKGHVILSGFVNRHLSIKDIRAAVKSIPGVHEVDNYVLYKQT